MANLKQQFSDLRKNTPKHIQWLLLAAAFVVVLILLTLLLTNKEEEKLENSEDVAINLTVLPDTIDWANVTVGESETETLKVSTTAPTKIMDVRLSDNSKDVSQTTTCTTIGQIDSSTFCSIDLTYKPTMSADAHSAELYIDWRGANEPDTMKKTEKVVLVLGAKEIKLPEPEPIVEETVVEEKSEPVLPTVKESIKEDLESIAPSSSFVFDSPAKYDTFIEEEPEYVRPSEACSDFAMPGYNLSGVQSGWIRPLGGTYYYYPFSDKNCENPTGVYNPDNGIITDIDNAAQKIGTDAEHIGYTTIQNGMLPQLSNPTSTTSGSRATQLTAEDLQIEIAPLPADTSKVAGIVLKDAPAPDVIVGTSGTAVFSSDPYDRKFVLRQYKPIPATIVSEVRADPSLYGCPNSDGQCSSQTLPVRATVDRNVYADDGRTIVIPTGTLMLGFVTGDLPGPYKSIGRMDIKWYQFILPSGVEFNFNNNDLMPFSGDSQGRQGVPGHGSTDYVEQLVMPMLTAIVPAAVNMIAPISDAFINQIDLDNNTVVQSGTIRSSELAKNEIITAWNQVAQKLIVDAMDNTIPPFSIAAGTRITVYSPSDLVITCGNDNSKECSVEKVQSASGLADTSRNTRNESWRGIAPSVKYSDPSWVGQVRSFNLERFCKTDADGLWDIDPIFTAGEIAESGYDYRTVLGYCQSLNYQAINNAKQDAYYQNQQNTFSNTYGSASQNLTQNGQISGLTGIQGDQQYNENVLGLTYNDDGTIQNPFADTSTGTTETVETVITCEGGALPDEYGCCPGEIYTDMGEQGFNCCPESDPNGNCFPPIQ